MSQDPTYVVAWSGPMVFERTRSCTSDAPLYLEEDLVAPSSGTYTLTDPSGATVVSGSVTVTGSIATYTVGSSTLADLALSERYFETWSLVIDGVTRTFRRDAAVCRSDLSPVVTDNDLYGLHSDLRDLIPTGKTSYRTYRETAYKLLLAWIRKGGSLPHLVCSPQDLWEAELYGTLEIIFRDFALSAGQDARWQKLADDYTRKAEQARKTANVKYDMSDSGTPGTDRRPVASVTVLGAGQYEPFPFGRSGTSW